jgi:iron complex outermembrane recepter protein
MNTARNPVTVSRKIAARLLVGSAAIAISTAAAYAQANTSGAPLDNTEKVETVVVTGTSIRGAVPVGQNLITVDRSTIEATGAQTVQQLLTTVPAIQGFGNAGQGGFGSADASGTNAPTVHGLGASASNGTLVLIDGHRLPLTGLSHSLGDPNSIPAIALQRVEVLPDGASSIYGSDAVAGVINFITRKHYDGLEFSTQAGFGDGYSTQNFGAVGGQNWDSGSVLVAYQWSNRSSLHAADRNFFALNKTQFGGQNFAFTNCSPAQVNPTGTANFYTSPYTGAPNNATTGKVCDFTNYSDILPSEVRNNALVSLSQDIMGVTLTADLVYSNRLGNQRQQRSPTPLGAITAFGPGATVGGVAVPASQINPFFKGPPGVTSETVLFDADDLLGPGSAVTKSGAQTVFGTLGADAALWGDWHLALGATVGQDNSFANVNGQLCAACVNLALNGTTATSGSTAATVLGAVSTTTLQNLSTPGAFVLDAWGGGNTSPATQQFLVGQTKSGTTQTIDDMTAKVDGSLFSLPAGDVKAAFGLEGIRYGLNQFTTRPASSSVSNLYLAANLSRWVTAAFAELRIPVVSEDMGLPLVKAFNFDASARYDHYSDFGGTTNPKFSVDWTIIDGLKARASYGTSFTAPALTSRGDANGITTESGFGVSSGNAGNTLLPTSFPGEAAFQAALPASAQAAQCTAAGCIINNNTINGVLVTGGNKNLKPETGSSRSFGADFSPTFLPGLHLSATYWISKYTGLITAPTLTNEVVTPGLFHKLTLCNGGCTSAQIAAAGAGLQQVSPLAATSYFIYSFQQDNAFNIDSAGIDFDAHYSFSTDDYGAFTTGVAGSQKTRFNEIAFGAAAGTPTVSDLNQNFNTTFSALALVSRFDIDWQFDPITANVFVNYEAPYKLINQPVALYPTGIQHVGPYTTVDFHVGYNLPFQDNLWTRNIQVYLDGTNIFDEPPPFYDVAAGYDGTDASPIGRVISVGLRKTF